MSEGRETGFLHFWSDEGSFHDWCCCFGPSIVASAAMGLIWLASQIKEVL